MQDSEGGREEQTWGSAGASRHSPEPLAVAFRQLQSSYTSLSFLTLEASSSAESQSWFACTSVLPILSAVVLPLNSLY